MAWGQKYSFTVSDIVLTRPNAPGFPYSSSPPYCYRATYPNGRDLRNSQAISAGLGKPGSHPTFPEPQTTVRNSLSPCHSLPTPFFCYNMNGPFCRVERLKMSDEVPFRIRGNSGESKPGGM